MRMIIFTTPQARLVQNRDILVEIPTAWAHIWNTFKVQRIITSGVEYGESTIFLSWVQVTKNR